LKIVSGTPPNFDAIKAALPAATRAGVIFTYGDTVYVNGDEYLPPALRAHEAVHVGQQRDYPGGPEAWWGRYLTDPTFRLSQEIPAHRAELHAWPKTNRNRKAVEAYFIATRLAGPLYGRLISISDALNAIR
jgi:hypothetical protein